MQTKDEPALLRRQVQALYAVADAMNAAVSRQEMLGRILETVVTELGYKGASLRLLDAENRTLVMQAAYGLSQSYLDKGEIEIAHSPIDQQMMRGEVVTLQDVSTDPGLQYPQEATQEGIRSILAVPLRSAQGLTMKIMGGLRVYTNRPHEFSQDEKAFLGAVANLAARALAFAHLYEALQEIARQVNSSLKVQEVLAALLHSLVSELNFKAASIRLLGERQKRLHVAAAEGLSPDYLAKGDVRVKDSPIDQEVLQGRSVMLFDVAHERGFQYQEEAEREGIRSVMAAPLAAQGGEVQGVLRVYSGQPHRFTPEEQAFVGAVADLGAIALENARLHEALEKKYQAAKEDWSGWFRFLAFG